MCINRLNKLTSFLWIVSVVYVACANSGSAPPMSHDQDKEMVVATPQESVTPQEAVKSDEMPKSPIRSVDFANFTYHWVAELDNLRKSFKLVNGELKGDKGRMGALLRSVVYGDVNGDGMEDAMVVLSVVTGGSAVPHLNYIYTLENGRPQLLWAFSTGDRSDGGLRQLYAENGTLVVERYFSPGSTGGCCASQFTRTHYAWQANQFHQQGSVETLSTPRPGEAATPITPPLNKSK